MATHGTWSCQLVFDFESMAASPCSVQVAMTTIAMLRGTSFVMLQVHRPLDVKRAIQSLGRVMHACILTSDGKDD